MTNIKEHFEEIAKDYDYYKKKNWYYYYNLKELLREKIKVNSNVFEVGCGTGNLISYVKPRRGFGIDISKNMIKIAKQKHSKEKNLKFMTGSAEDFKTIEKFDYIFMADVIEHLGSVEKTIKNISKIMDKKTLFIVTMINPIWEPILMSLEKLKMKMPEGPHNRVNLRYLKKEFIKNKLELERISYRIIIPAPIPLVADFFNSFFHRMPLVKRMCLVQVLEIRKNR